MGSALLITHGQVFTLGQGSQYLADGALYVEGDTIRDVGSTADLEPRYPEAERLDAARKWVLPGSLCGHTHFYGAFARGMAIPGAPANDFVEILEKLWWRLDCALGEEDIRYSALVCLADAIRHGTTTLIDHHASPNAIDGSLDILAAATKESGLRASLCYEVTDRNGRDGAVAGIHENLRFIRRCRQEKDPQLGASFGLHAALTLSDETLATCAALAEPLHSGFHVHVAEGIADQRESLRLHNMRVVERLHKFGILGPNTIAGHCVHLDAREKEILAETGTMVSHQPRSNMNNAVGLPDVAGLLEQGILVALGNDGFSNDMFSEMKAAYLAHKLVSGNPQAMPGDAVMRMAYENNARLASRFFPPAGAEPKALGELSPGAFADIIFLDYAPPTPATPGNLPWHLIFGVDGGHVTHTIVGGRLLMKDRQLLTVDEEAVTARARELARRVWDRI